MTNEQEILNILLIQGSARRGLSGGGVVRQVAVRYPSVQNAFARINISIVIPSKQIRVASRPTGSHQWFSSI